MALFEKLFGFRFHFSHSLTTFISLPIQDIKMISTDSDGSRLEYFFPAWVGLGQPSQGRESFPRKCQFFIFGSKKISSGWVKEYQGQRRVAPYLPQVRSILGLDQVKVHL